MLKPVDIEKKEFKKVALGYSEEEVDSFLNFILEDYDLLYTENIELKDKITLLNQSIDEYRSMEKTLQTTLNLAQEKAEEMKEAARFWAEEKKKEAQNQADGIIQEAKEQFVQMEQEFLKLKKKYELTCKRIKILLYAEIDLIDKTNIFANKDEEETEKSN